MRHPTTHKFLIWAGPAAAGVITVSITLLAALAQPYPDVKDWGAKQFNEWRPTVTAPWFLVAILVMVAAYVAAVVWTGSAGPPAPPSDYLRDALAREKADWFARALHGNTRQSNFNPSSLWLQNGIEDDLEKQSLDRTTKWEAERQIQNTPQRNVGLAEALAYAELKQWDRSFFDAASSAKNEANEQLDRFRQLAHDGDLTVWGKRTENGVFQLIPKEHWLDHNVEWFDLLRGNPRTENVLRATPQPYSELMVNKAEFEREWPHV